MAQDGESLTLFGKAAIASAWALMGLMFWHAVLMGVDPRLCMIGCKELNPRKLPPVDLAPDPSEADALKAMCAWWVQHACAPQERDEAEAPRMEGR